MQAVLLEKGIPVMAPFFMPLLKQNPADLNEPLKAIRQLMNQPAQDINEIEIGTGAMSDIIANLFVFQIAHGFFERTCADGNSRRPR